jgi:hypothetical protein
MPKSPIKNTPIDRVWNIIILFKLYQDARTAKQRNTKLPLSVSGRTEGQEVGTVSRLPALVEPLRRL